MQGQPQFQAHPPQFQAPQGFGPPPTNFNNNWYSSYAAQIQPQEWQEIQAWFNGVDRDRSGSITAQEIAGITFNGQALGLDVATKLVKIFDKDHSNSVDFYEYASLHKFLTGLQQAFFAGDRDRSGRLDANEIHVALGQVGFGNVSLPVVKSMTARYVQPGFGPTGLTFHDFLLVVATIAQTRSLFEWRDTSRSGKLTVTLEQLLEIVGDAL
eukprot:TRINITY_DN2135_c0_g2_i3.p1 TRINITY_DN2135_c0_g2~~TRINITY_DN2135_c0_g2_i3.p1  ORF type:complete len:228 (+),score=62.52 TRINITY_DN2135_c0_g2_i3:50-685(+)